MLTIGFIGNGKSANRYHMPFILQRPDKIKVKKFTLVITQQTNGMKFLESFILKA